MDTSPSSYLDDLKFVSLDIKKSLAKAQQQSSSLSPKNKNVISNGGGGGGGEVDGSSGMIDGDDDDENTQPGSPYVSQYDDDPERDELYNPPYEPGNFSDDDDDDTSVVVGGGGGSGKKEDTSVDDGKQKPQKKKGVKKRKKKVKRRSKTPAAPKSSDMVSVSESHKFVGDDMVSEASVSLQVASEFVAGVENVGERKKVKRKKRKSAVVQSARKPATSPPVSPSKRVAKKKVVKKKVKKSSSDNGVVAVDDTSPPTPQEQAAADEQSESPQLVIDASLNNVSDFPSNPVSPIQKKKKKKKKRKSTIAAQVAPPKSFEKEVDDSSLPSYMRSTGRSRAMTVESARRAASAAKPVASSSSPRKRKVKKKSARSVNSGATGDESAEVDHSIVDEASVSLVPAADMSVEPSISLNVNGDYDNSILDVMPPPPLPDVDDDDDDVGDIDVGPPSHRVERSDEVDQQQPPPMFVTCSVCSQDVHGDHMLEHQRQHEKDRDIDAISVSLSMSASVRSVSVVDGPYEVCRICGRKMAPNHIKSHERRCARMKKYADEDPTTTTGKTSVPSLNVDTVGKGSTSVGGGELSPPLSGRSDLTLSSIRMMSELDSVSQTSRGSRLSQRSDWRYRMRSRRSRSARRARRSRRRTSLNSVEGGGVYAKLSPTAAKEFSRTNDVQCEKCQRWVNADRLASGEHICGPSKRNFDIPFVEDRSDPVYDKLFQQYTRQFERVPSHMRPTDAEIHKRVSIMRDRMRLREHESEPSSVMTSSIPELSSDSRLLLSTASQRTRLRDDREILAEEVQRQREEWLRHRRLIKRRQLDREARLEEIRPTEETIGEDEILCPQCGRMMKMDQLQHHLLKCAVEEKERKAKLLRDPMRLRDLIMDMDQVCLENYEYPGHYLRFVRKKNYYCQLQKLRPKLNLGTFTFIVGPGLARGQVNLGISLESAITPGSYLCHQNDQLQLQRDDPSMSFQRAATWKVKPGLGGDSHEYVSLESTNKMNYYISHVNGHVVVAKYEQSETFAARASFKVVSPSKVTFIDGSKATIIRTPRTPRMSRSVSFERRPWSPSSAETARHIKELREQEELNLRHALLGDAQSDAGSTTNKTRSLTKTVKKKYSFMKDTASSQHRREQSQTVEEDEND